MEVTEPVAQFDDHEEFHDALDDFAFYDCQEKFSEVVESSEGNSISIDDNMLPPSTIHRRRPISRYKSSADSMDSTKLDSSASMEDYLTSRRKKSKLFHKIKEPVLKHRKEYTGDNIVSAEKSHSSKDEEISSLTDAKEGEGGEYSVENQLSSGESYGNRDASSNLLVLLSGMIIKAISFQFDLCAKFIMFPMWSMYYLYMLVFNPFGFLKRGRECFIWIVETVWSALRENVPPIVYKWFKEHEAIWKLGLKCGWGLLWSGYVCAVLLGLLVLSFVIGGLMIRSVVEEPIRISRTLNFDYTEKSPLTLVPLTGNLDISHGIFLGEKPEVGMYGGSRVLPRSHKLQVMILLTLPESEYNQNLGIFQVRVDFLAADGKTLASSRLPCMLHYRSPPIRLLLTFLKVAPILTGFSSETQNLKINFRGFTEGVIPTASIRVTIEQRAEFLPGAGIPEIYSSSLTLESELPFLKKVMWFWKKSLLVWLSMTVFTCELLFALLCCKSMIIPKIRLREQSTNEAAAQIEIRPGQG